MAFLFDTLKDELNKQASSGSSAANEFLTVLQEINSRVEQNKPDVKTAVQHNADSELAMSLSRLLPSKKSSPQFHQYLMSLVRYEDRNGSAIPVSLVRKAFFIHTVKSAVYQHIFSSYNPTNFFGRPKNLSFEEKTAACKEIFKKWLKSLKSRDFEALAIKYSDNNKITSNEWKAFLGDRYQVEPEINNRFSLFETYFLSPLERFCFARKVVTRQGVLECTEEEIPSQVAVKRCLASTEKAQSTRNFALAKDLDRTYKIGDFLTQNKGLAFSRQAISQFVSNSAIPDNQKPAILAFLESKAAGQTLVNFALDHAQEMLFKMLAGNFGTFENADRSKEMLNAFNNASLHWKIDQEKAWVEVAVVVPALSITFPNEKEPSLYGLQENGEFGEIDKEQYDEIQKKLSTPGGAYQWKKEELLCEASSVIELRPSDNNTVTPYVSKLSFTSHLNGYVCPSLRALRAKEIKKDDNDAPNSTSAIDQALELNKAFMDARAKERAERNDSDNESRGTVDSSEQVPSPNASSFGSLGKDLPFGYDDYSPKCSSAGSSAGSGVYDFFDNEDDEDEQKERQQLAQSSKKGAECYTALFLDDDEECNSLSSSFGSSVR